MRAPHSAVLALAVLLLPCASLVAQQSSPNSAYDPAPDPSLDPGPAPIVSPSPVPLEWVPPALAHLATLATVKESFTLDRNLLAAASAFLPDSDSDGRLALRKLDGVSVHTMRFGPDGIPDEQAVAAIRENYHLRGWKHLVSATDPASTSPAGLVHTGTTDVWVVMDGVSVRGAVILAETPRSLTLVTVAGNLNPVDLLHLRGHFGIPRYSAPLAQR